jgi:hypothetical protein
VVALVWLFDRNLYLANKSILALLLDYWPDPNKVY